jgi:hypothetical protein
MGRRDTRSAVLALLAGAALAAAGCGATPPQVSPADAHRLGGATGTISSACGEALQLTAFGGLHAHGLSALDATAARAARRLAASARARPDAIYQGKRLSVIAQDAAEMLRSCGLARAAAPLAR